MAAAVRNELELNPATIKGLGRKRGLTLEEYLALGPQAMHFILDGPAGQENRAVIDVALAELAARKAAEQQ
ncbi:MAG TPA: hypothetical protein VNE63_16970 [Candidatus Acidoferrales bacterium]|nr:hypothetical protein [Candidatus Acidoferrales bacterium]